jgi:hypothetical protein
MASHASRHTGKNSGFSTQDEHLVLLGLEALTDTSNFRSATRSNYILNFLFPYCIPQFLGTLDTGSILQVGVSTNHIARYHIPKG